VIRARTASLALAVAAAACGAAGEEQRAPAARPTRLVLIVLDTTRADHLGCYGRRGADTPALDRLAAEGARFDLALASSSLTPVSVASVLTGVHPYRHGVRSLFAVGRGSLAWEGATLFERLAPAVEAGAAFVGARPLSAKYGLGRGLELYQDDMGPAAERNKARGLPNPQQRRADETTDLFLAWLDEHAGAPFAALVHFFDTHGATLIPPRDFRPPRVTFELPPDLDRLGNLAGGGGAPRLKSSAHAIELYDAELAWCDRQVGRIVDALERAGVLDETLVVVVGDHGEGLGQHGFWTHGLLWNEQLRVPLILRGPGVPRASAPTARVRLVDVHPTVVELFGLAPSADLDGASLVPLLDGREERAPREVYAEAHHAADDFLGRDSALYTLVAGKWKYVHRPATGAHELYDLERDPGEQDNAYRAGHPAVAGLRARLSELGALDGHTVDPGALAPEELDALRDLGYFGEDD
jgi:arylsulfatase A-like enzyme